MVVTASFVSPTLGLDVTLSVTPILMNTISSFDYAVVRKVIYLASGADKLLFFPVHTLLTLHQIIYHANTQNAEIAGSLIWLMFGHTGAVFVPNVSMSLTAVFCLFGR